MNLFIYRIAFLLVLCTPVAQSTIVTINNNATFSSLPTVFGKFLVPFGWYTARLVYSHTDSPLCDPTIPADKRWNLPLGSNDISVDNYGRDSPYISSLPFAILVPQGDCRLADKIKLAESLDPSIHYMIVYNNQYGSEGYDQLLPQQSYIDTRLGLLSIPYKSGMALHKWLDNINQEQEKEDGNNQPANSGTPAAIIRFDGSFPENYSFDYTTDYDSSIQSTLGMLFMCITFVILMLRLGQRPALRSGDQSLIVPSTPNLLTREQVLQIAQQYKQINEASKQADESFDNNNNVELTDQNDSSRTDFDAAANIVTCAICIEDLLASDDEYNTTSSTTRKTPVTSNNIEDGADYHNIDNDCCHDDQIITLPCNHAFHADCIIPWLTERQSNCPLCKLDIMQIVQDQHTSNDLTIKEDSVVDDMTVNSGNDNNYNSIIYSNGSNGIGEWSSFLQWSRLVRSHRVRARYRWQSQRVNIATDESNNGMVGSAVSNTSNVHYEMAPGLELTEL